ncbi:MAG TPA: aspartate/glutamate racemase family protein, partial [Variovorax sp.]|nr:aspartate/glutamate racemase family protein [Variovorax sp.]
MRLLVINPNISESVTALIEAEARRSAEPGTGITMKTAAFGVAYIETRFEALIGAWATAQLAAEHHAGHDAVIVAAFGDPGLAGLREALPVPVLGMTESALATAALLGHRFSIVAISQRIQAWYREMVESHGLIGRLASIRALDRPLARIGGVQDEHADALLALCERAVKEDGAEVIVLAGAPLAGLARTLRGRLPVPVVDGVSSAVRHAATLVALAPGRATAGSFA